MIKDMVFWGWRWLVVVALACFAGGLIWAGVDAWRDNVDLDRNGAVAEVPIVAIHGQGRQIVVDVRMPDGEIAEIGERPGMRAGGWVDVVYRVDDMADARLPGAPADGAVGYFFAASVPLVLAGLAFRRLLVRPFRNLPTVRWGRGYWRSPRVPTPRQLKELEVRAHRRLAAPMRPWWWETFWRLAGILALVAVAGGLAFGAYSVWQDESDLQRNGSVAEVPVTSVHAGGYRDPATIKVRMPDGEIAEIDDDRGYHAGEWIDVVYRVDDMADPDLPDSSSADAASEAFLPAALCLIVLLVVVVLTVKTVRDRLFGPIRHEPTVAVPQRTFEQDARARKARRSAKRSRADTRRKTH